MYKEFETKTSYKYLQEVIKALQEPICILGGWAVFFHVNEKFQKAQGRPYLGSRDIDLGFHLDKNSSIEQMKNSLLATKLNAMPQRDKEHKKTKDICDIFALLWYSGRNVRDLSSNVPQFISI